MSYQEMTAENGKIQFVDGAEKVFFFWLILFFVCTAYYCSIPKDILTSFK